MVVNDGVVLTEILERATENHTSFPERDDGAPSTTATVCTSGMPSTNNSCDSNGIKSTPLATIDTTDKSISAAQQGSQREAAEASPKD